GAAACRLILELIGLDGPPVTVLPGACRVCCRGPVPTASRMNPVIASMLSRVAEDAISAGGRAGFSVEKASQVFRWANDRLLWVAPPRDRAAKRRSGGLPIGVAILCQDAHESLLRTLESVLLQTIPAQEIVIIDATGGETVAHAVRPYGEVGVGHVRAPSANPFVLRGSALEKLSSPIICLLEPNDLLPSTYFERALPLF